MEGVYGLGCPKWGDVYGLGSGANPPLRLSSQEVVPSQQSLVEMLEKAFKYPATFGDLFSITPPLLWKRHYYWEKKTILCFI